MYRIRRRALAKRPSLPFADIYNEYFSSLPCSLYTAERVWNDLSSDLRVDPDKLRPTDRFDKEPLVCSPWLDPFEEGDEEWRLEDRVYAAEKAGVITPSTITYDTVQEYVEISCRLESLTSDKSRQ